MGAGAGAAARVLLLAALRRGVRRAVHTTGAECMGAGCGRVHAMLIERLVVRAADMLAIAGPWWLQLAAVCG